MEAANNQYTKKQLTHFIEHHDLDIAKSWKKADIVEALTEWMKTARKDVLDSNSDLQSFYSESVVNTNESMNVYDDTLSDDSLENILKLVEHGLAYNVEGQLWVPEGKDSEENESSTQVNEPEKIATKKLRSSNSQSKKTSPSASSSFGHADSIEDKKKARLEYLKLQAKRKKKGKKRK